MPGRGDASLRRRRGRPVVVVALRLRRELRLYLHLVGLGHRLVAVGSSGSLGGLFVGDQPLHMRVELLDRLALLDLGEQLVRVRQ